MTAGTNPTPSHAAPSLGAPSAAAPAAQARPLLQRLGVRLALALAIALLPLGVISGMQSASLQKEARARSEAALLGETLLAAGPEAALIRSARVAAEVLAATLPRLLDDPAKCREIMRSVMDQSRGSFSFVVYVPPSGLTNCTSSSKAFDLSKSERLAIMRTRGEADVVVIRNGVASGQSVLAFGHPVYDDQGRSAGYVSISVPHSVLESRDIPDVEIRPMGRVAPSDLITFDAGGVILTSSTGLDDAPQHLPANIGLTDLAMNTARTFTAGSEAGGERIYAVFPLVESKIFAIGSWPVVAAGGPLSLAISPYVMPLLMWLASLFVAMLAAERLITRHIRALRASITRFADGDHRVEGLGMPDAAIEIRDVADAYMKMTDTILRDSAELENIIHQREVLLREVHHRVKNNLQLIASIMNMQIRQSRSAEAKVLMKGLQDRVMSLATIHRGLYQTSGLTDVRADELLADILRQILKMATGPGRTFDLVTGFDDLRLTPDQAVPLSLLLTEAVTNAVKYAGTDNGGRPHLSVTFRRMGPSDAVLTITNSVGSKPIPSESGPSLGSQLLEAFGQQLDAVSETSLVGGFYTLRVQFVVRSLAHAEAGSEAVGEPEGEADPEPQTSAAE